MGDPSAVGEEKLDEQALRAIAETTGGTYAFAGDRAQLESVYEGLEALDTREAETQSHRPRRDLFHWPLGAFVLLTMGFFGALHAPVVLRARGRT